MKTRNCISALRMIYGKSSHPAVFLGKGVLKICNKFTGEYPCRSAISIKLLCNFSEIALQHGCSPVNLLHIFRIPFLKNTSGRLLLIWCDSIWRKALFKKLLGYGVSTNFASFLKNMYEKNQLSCTPT